MIEIKERYNWIKQPNDKYTILNVPIFSCFQDDERGKVDSTDAIRIVNTFKQDIKKGFYPPVFVGHHSDLEARHRVGFLDNLSFKDNIFYSDLTEIEEKDFKAFLEMKYPYRSIELGKSNAINGLALLESQHPYFKFPMLALEEKPINISKFQEETFLLRNKFMANPLDNDVVSTSGEVLNPNNAEKPEKRFEGGVEEKLDLILKGQASLASVLAQLFKAEQEEQENESDEGEFESDEEPDEESDEELDEEPDKESEFCEGCDRLEEKNRSKSPIKSSVAYQHLERKYFQLENKLNAILSGGSKHMLSNILDSSNFSSRTKSFMANFQEEPIEIQKIAMEAFNCFQDSVRHPDSSYRVKFSTLWGDTPEKFVTHVVEQSRVNPDYLKKLTMSL